MSIQVASRGYLRPTTTRDHHIDGTVVIIGLGSIGKAVLPLLDRHFTYAADRLTVIDPDPAVGRWLARHDIRHVHLALTRQNFQAVLGEVFGDEGGFCVNLSVNVSSLDIMRLCRRRGILYIDTVVEPWDGFYFGPRDNAARTNYALRQTVRDETARHPGGSTAVSCCGANPGMVSWLVKEALFKLAHDLGRDDTPPETQIGWAQLMRSLGILGLHIAERDTQVCSRPRPHGTFVNTWSVDGFIAEACQPAELGWGTFEPWFPDDGHMHQDGCRAAIWLDRPGAVTRVRTWCPTAGPQFGFLVTHNEAVSIADYYTVPGPDGDPSAPAYRPTCHYAYHPCDDAMLSLHEMFGAGRKQLAQEILAPDAIVEGGDELGVLLYGHERNALWYGSRLLNKEARRLAPWQNATGLQVSSALIAGMIWALENPRAGIVEADEMDHERCLAIQRPYLGAVEGHYTDWTPLTHRLEHFPGDVDLTQPWAFRNVLAT